MKFQTDYRFFRLQSSQLKIFDQLIFLHYILPVVHLVCFTSLLVLDMADQIYGSSDLMVAILKKVKTNCFSPDSAMWYALFGNLLTLIMVFLSFVTFKLIKNYDKINEKKKLEHSLLLITICIFYISQVTIYLAGWAFSAILSTQGLSFAMLLCVLPFAYFTYINVTYEYTSLYGWQTVPIILCITLDNILIYYFYVIFSLVHLLYLKKFLIEKICITLSLFQVIFVVMNSSQLLDYNSSGNQQSPISFLCLAIVLLLASIVISKMRQTFLLDDPHQIMNKIYKTINQVKGDIPYTSLNFQQYYDLYNNMSKLISSKRQKDSKAVETLLEKDHTKLTKKEFFQLFQAYLDNISKNQSDNNTLALILLVKVRMQLDYPFSKIAEQFFSISEKFQRGKQKNMYQFMELFELTIQKYGILKNQDLQISYALHVNQLHEDFEIETLQILDKINKFWSQCAQKELNMAVIQESFGQIYEKKIKIDQIYKKLVSYENIKKQKTMMEVLESILNPYLITKESLHASNNHLTEENSMESMSFVILQNNLIRFTSKDFLKSMGKTNQLLYENVDKSQIFGNQLTGLVDNLIEKMTNDTQASWVTVPVICKDNLIKVMKIRILWFPSLQVQKKLMIKFSEHQSLAKSSFLVYHYQTDTIKYFNQNFINSFKVNQEKFTFRLNNEKIFFNEIFVSQESDQENIKKSLSVGTKTKCKIYLGKYVKKGCIQTYNVEIQVASKLNIENGTQFAVLKVQRVTEEKILASWENTITESRRELHEKDENGQAMNQKSLMKKYENEEFFCRLPNLYEGTITEKQSQLEDDTRITYLKFMALLFLVLAVSLFVFWGFENSFLQQRLQQYRKGITSIENTSQQYALLYQMYSLAIQRYFLQMYPEQAMIAMNVPASTVESDSANAQQIFLNDFLQKYLVQLKKPPNSRIDYSIDFDNFLVETNSELSTLIDFAQNFKTNIFDHSIEFLLRNYDHFRQLTVNYENSFNYKQTLDNVISDYETYLWILIFSAVALLFIINLLFCQIDSAIDMVFGLVQKLERKQIKEHILEFNQQRKKLIAIFNQSQFSFAMNQDTLIENTETMKGLFTQSEVQTVKMLEFQHQNHDKITNPNNSFGMLKKSSNFIDQSDEAKEKELAKKQKELIVEKRLIIKEPFLKKLSRKTPFILLTLALVLIFFYDRSTLTEQRLGLTQIYEMKSQFYVSLLHIKRQEVDAGIIPTQRHFYKNSLMVDKYLRENVTLVASLPTKMNLQELSGFQYEAFNILTSNLCDYIGDYALLAIKPCDTYLGGIVTKGFKSTIDKYIENGKKLASQSVSQFGGYACTESKCPEFFEHLFTSVLMGETLRHLLKHLSESTEVAFGRMGENGQFRILMKLLSVFLACIGYGFYWGLMKERCKQAQLFFTMIPKSIMCSLKMTIYLRKSKFFETMEMI